MGFGQVDLVGIFDLENLFGLIIQILPLFVPQINRCFPVTHNLHGVLNPDCSMVCGDD